MRSNGKLILSGIATCVLAGSCKVPYCQDHETEQECQITFELTRDKYTKGFDNAINVKVALKGDEPISARLSQGSKEVDLIANLVNENNYSLSLGMENDRFKGFQLGELNLNLQQGFRKADPVKLRIVKSVAYPAPTVFTSPTVAKASQPVLEFMGIGKDIFGLVSGTIVGTDVRSVRRYVFGASGLTESTPTSEFFSNPPVSSSALISVTANSIYLSENPEGSPVTGFKCSTSNPSVQKSDCTQLGFSLPPKTKTMLVTPDETRMLLADEAGTISGCALPMEKPPCPGMITTGAGVLMTLADLNNDKKVDLIAAWQASGQLKVGVFLAAATGGFARVADANLSGQLSASMGNSPIDAIAAGDIDGDGFDGDLVFGRGLRLTVLQSQLDRFEAVWSADLDPAKASPGIKALAVGRLDANSTPDKPMDIVVSSNTSYDAMNQSSLFIHIFRPL